eukprot:GHVN01044719.1.p1 GENE.GHVN01044719.1~~GHVN01044719.1.p1  ORF type:complete len:276 (+),score=56.20 GHVN01044719.1:195-1022(+)
MQVSLTSFTTLNALTSLMYMMIISSPCLITSLSLLSLNLGPSHSLAFFSRHCHSRASSNPTKISDQPCSPPHSSHASRPQHSYPSPHSPHSYRSPQLPHSFRSYYSPRYTLPYKHLGLSGIRDIYPHEMKKVRWFIDECHDVSRLYGFEEYLPPLVERFKDVNESDVDDVTKQTYRFIDRGGNSVAIRPEVTQGMARMVTQWTHASHDLPHSPFPRIVFPLCWYTLGSCFRYEKTGFCRRREHLQWNVDVIGEKSLRAEAKVIQVLTEMIWRLFE